MSKYNNRKSTAGGHAFDSKKERDRYLVLRTLERAGEIKDLELQPRYDFHYNGELICFYKADFRYTDLRDGYVQIVEDVKGYKTPMYRLKKKMMWIFHRIRVFET